MSVDPLASERSWLSPYNYVQNNPMLRIDPDGRLDDYYNRQGQFLYRDNQETDNIRIIHQGDFDNIQHRFLGDMYDNSKSNVGLWKALENKSTSINRSGISYEAASNIFTDILQREGFDLENVFNKKVSIHSGTIPGRGFNGGLNGTPGANANIAIKGIHRAFAENAPDGKFKITAIYNEKWGSRFLNSVSNVVSILGVHELTGHGIMKLGFGETEHKIVYQLQFDHDSFKTISPSYKKYLED